MPPHIMQYTANTFGNVSYISPQVMKTLASLAAHYDTAIAVDWVNRTVSVYGPEKTHYRDGKPVMLSSGPMTSKAILARIEGF